MVPGRQKAEETENYFVYDVRYRLEEQPLVSVIIPTKDHADLLKGAIDSIFEKTEYSNYEILFWIITQKKRRPSHILNRL